MGKKTTIMVSEDLRQKLDELKGDGSYDKLLKDRFLGEKVEPTGKKGSLFNVEELKTVPDDEWDLIYKLPLIQMHHILNPAKQDCGERLCIDIRRWLDKRIDTRIEKRKVVKSVKDEKTTKRS
jgi:hypothetical protein